MMELGVQVGGASRDCEALGGGHDRVEVAHPHLLLGRLVGVEEQALGDQLELGASVLALAGGGDLAAELQ